MDVFLGNLAAGTLSSRLLRALNEAVTDDVIGAWLVWRDRKRAVITLSKHECLLLTEKNRESYQRNEASPAEPFGVSEVRLPGSGSFADLHFDEIEARDTFLEAWHAVGDPESEARLADAWETGFDRQMPRSRRDRSYAMIDDLATRRKYDLALQGKRLANVSLVGTEDWEDYASLAFRAMLLECSLDSDQRLEQLVDRVDKLERHLCRIVELLETSKG